MAARRLKLRSQLLIPDLLLVSDSSVKRVPPPGFAALLLLAGPSGRMPGQCTDCISLSVRLPLRRSAPGYCPRKEMMPPTGDACPASPPAGIFCRPCLLLPWAKGLG